jgi:ABC-type multidrug transport system ATPase subunit
MIDEKYALHVEHDHGTSSFDAGAHTLCVTERGVDVRAGAHHDGKVASMNFAGDTWHLYVLDKESIDVDPGIPRGLDGSYKIKAGSRISARQSGTRVQIRFAPLSSRTQSRRVSPVIAPITPPSAKPPISSPTQTVPVLAAGLLRILPAGRRSLTVTAVPQVIGSSPDASVRLQGTDVALQHAEIVKRGDHLEIRSLARTYYPIVNGKPCAFARLLPGHEVLIGHHLLLIEPGNVLTWSDADEPEPAHVLQVDGLEATYQGRAVPVLRGFSLTVKSGELVAVIGPSGLGKSTLCKAIIGEAMVTGGAIRFDTIDLVGEGVGYPNLVSYVPQHVDLHDELSVERTMYYASELRSDRGSDPTERRIRIDKVLDQVNLTGELRRGPVGKLSGGQRQRLSIALELLTDPPLLLLDEPTASLDDGNARDIMEILREEADRGRIVIVVTHALHQLALADAVVAVGKNGQVVYAGPRAELPSAFGVHNYADVMSVIADGKESSRRQPHPLPTPMAAAPLGSRPKAKSNRTGSRWRTLTRREWERPRTRLRAFLPMAAVFVIVAVVVAWLAAPDGLRNGTDGDSRIAVLILTTCLSFFSIAFSFCTISDDLEVIRRESRWGISARDFVLARFLGALPWAVGVCLAVALSYLLVSQFMGKLPEDPALPVWPAVTILMVMIGVVSVAAGLALSALAETPKQTVLYLMVYLAFQVMLCGLTVSLTKSGVGLLNALSYAVPARWAVVGWAAELRFVADPADDLWQAGLLHFSVALAILAAASIVLVLAAQWLLARRMSRSNERGR